MKRTMKKLIYFTLGLAAILAISLAIHLYDVMEASPKGNPSQLARIDIQEDFSAEQFAKIKSDFNKIEGVTHAYINPDSKRLIFSFNPQTHKSSEIFTEFAENSSVNSELYIPSKELAASGCPINKDQGVAGKLISLFE